MKTYRGYRQMTRGTAGGKVVTFECVVTVEDGPNRPARRLELFTHLRNHSPTGFEWGYFGSGPAQLALALVADCCGEDLARPGIYQGVKRGLVACLPNDGWILREEQIQFHVDEAIRAERNDARELDRLDG